MTIVSILGKRQELSCAIIPMLYGPTLYGHCGKQMLKTAAPPLVNLAESMVGRMSFRFGFLKPKGMALIFTVSVLLSSILWELASVTRTSIQRFSSETLLLKE